MRTFADIERNPDRRTLASFRWTTSIGGTAMGGVLWIVAHRPTGAVVAATVGVGVALLSFIPGLGRRLYVAWMTLGVAMGKVTSPILLGAVWLIVVTPCAWLLRIAGKDPMKRRPEDSKRSFWEPHPPPGEPKRYFMQY